MGKRLFFATVVLAFSFSQMGDCLAAITLDQGTQCCYSMPGAPASHTRPCCKNTVSAQNPGLPTAHVALPHPTVATLAYPLLTVVMGHSPKPSLDVAAQHSPPNLYTLHSSLLI